MSVAFLQAGSVNEQGNGHATIQPGFGLGFPNTADDIVLLVAATSGAVGYELENAGWNELLLHQFDAGVDLAFGVWWTPYEGYGDFPTIDVDAWSQKTEFCQMMYFTGNDPNTPIGEVGTVGFGTSDSVIGPIPGLDAPAVPGGGVVAFGIRRDGHSSDIATLSGDVTWEEITDNARLGLGDASLAMAIDLGVDDVGGTTVTDKTFTQTGGDDANWLGFMFTINPLVITPSSQGWPLGDVAAAPADGQGWPRGVFPNASAVPPVSDGRQDAILATSPVAYWPMREDFTEKVGGAAPDLTAYGSPSFEGGAVRLDGTTDHMKAVGFNPYSGENILTFCVYMARDAVGSYQAVLGSYLSSYDFYFVTASSNFAVNNEIGTQVYAGSLGEDFIGTEVIGPVFIELSDTDDTLKIWLADTSLLNIGLIYPVEFDALTEPDFAVGLDIGIENTGAGSYFPGLLSDVAVWNRALSGGERTAIAEATL